MKKLILLFFLITFSQFAFSSNYYFSYQSQASSACGGTNLNLSNRSYYYAPNTDYCFWRLDAAVTGATVNLTTGVVTCPSGMTYESYSCVSQNIVCPPAGEQRRIQVQTSTSSGAAVIFQGGANQNAVFNQCKYDFLVSATQGPNSDCYKQGTITYCNVYATSLGVTDVVSPPAPVVSPADVAIPKSTKNGCVNGVGTDGKMVEVCASPSVPGTAEINGVPVHVRPDTTEINGVPVTPTSPKNCGTVNGQYTCVTTQANGTYGTSSGGTVTYWKFRPDSSSSETTVTNPDGSVTKTKTTTDNVIGSVPLVETTTTTTGGSVTKTTTGGQVGSSAQTDSAALQSIAKGVSDLGKGMDLSTVNKNTGDTATNTKALLDSLNDWKSGTFTGDGHSGDSALGDAIAADQAVATNALSLANFPNPFTDAIPVPVDFFPGMLPSANSSACSSSGIHQQVMSKWDFDFNPCEKLLPLREVLAWAFSILAMLDILKITFRGQT
ncbi:hypothetical protein ACQE3D_11770 [Methylomonas sp. MS20]|uniref:hypothetical protein n=1 Tax=unclassified Methylomonas TaxID=2608980 RepID=UPI0028A4369A|nr:hypothetical protein [Methylomonas sp. MV1]MDT4328326.1 hypothetical protein [Methylomonas sp. MV1]